MHQQIARGCYALAFAVHFYALGDRVVKQRVLLYVNRCDRVDKAAELFDVYIHRNVIKLVLTLLAVNSIFKSFNYSLNKMILSFNIIFFML